MDVGDASRRGRQFRRSVLGRLRGHRNIYGHRHSRPGRKGRDRHGQRSNRADRRAAAEGVHRGRGRRRQQSAGRHSGDVHGAARRRHDRWSAECDGQYRLRRSGSGNLDAGAARGQREQPRRGQFPLESRLPGCIFGVGPRAGRAHEDHDFRRGARQQQQPDSRRHAARRAHQRPEFQRQRVAIGACGSNRRSGPVLDSPGPGRARQAARRRLDCSTARRVSITRVRRGHRVRPEQHRRATDLPAAAEHVEPALRQRDVGRRHADDS